MRDATGEVLALIERGRSYADDDPERFYIEVEALMSKLLDFDRFARNVMGVYYRQATADQRKEFAESFKWSLVRTYALALTDFRDGKVEVVPPRRPPRRPDSASVTQEITAEGRTYMVIYDMQRRDARWSLRNMIIEGVNIGLNYKSQFAAAMKGPKYGGDLDRVIAAWSDTIAAEAAELEAEGEQGSAGGTGQPDTAPQAIES